MYQLGLSPATAEVSTMSLALGANRWASRVVVILQLAAWTAVGIVLLQKGVSSLQKTAALVEGMNATKINSTETVGNLMIKKIPSENFDAGSDLVEPPNVARDGENPDEMSSNTLAPIEPFALLTPNHSSIERTYIGKNDEVYEREKHRGNSGYRPTFRDEESANDEDDEESTESPASSNSSSKKYDRLFEAKKKLQIQTNLNGGGAAAAAVAMVAVGAVMLILGPAVIILRALDERRQERRFLKLSGQDDLPPSYEQATLMDEAPRYSTLSLNTINCSPGVAGNSSTVENTITAEGVREV